MLRSVRLNFLKPRPLAPGRPILRATLLVALFAAVGGGTFGWVLRWMSEQEMNRMVDDKWSSANRTDLERIPKELRERMASIVSLGAEIDGLRGGSQSLNLAASDYGRMLGVQKDAQGLSARGDQLEVSLRGLLEQFHQGMETLVALPAEQRDAALRILSYGRWRLMEGEYGDAIAYYEARRAEIAARPTATATPPPTSTPTHTPTQTPKRGRAPARKPPTPKVP